MDTRPTRAMVRESLFNILAPWLEDSVVLDLFAGSGALGLEALSRGACCATFVDRSRSAQAAIQANIDALGYADRARLLKADWRAAAARLAREGAAFSLVLLDPPYALPEPAAMLEQIVSLGLLAQDGLVVYEHAENHTPACGSLQLTRTRAYGDTALSFLTRK